MSKNSIVNDVMYLTTPVDKLIQNIKTMPSNGKPYAVILGRGNFSPIHEENLSEMESAKQDVETSGLQVIGGYLSPSLYPHLGYQGILPPVEERSLLIEQMVKDNPWIHQDRWESLYLQVEINSLDLKDRLERYLNTHIETDVGIEVYHMYCGDYERKTDICVQDYWSTKDVYAVRNDLSKSFSGLGIHLSSDEADMWANRIADIFKSAFNGFITVKELKTYEQSEKAEAILKEKGLPSISLDVFVRGDANLDVCRLFDLSSMQIWSKRISNRPQTPTLDVQVEAITPGEYILIEDDMPTGENTMRRVKELFQDRVQIKDMLILSHLDDQSDVKYYDIVDTRDFIWGAKHGGLVVELPNGDHARAPYVLPYVSPAIRARIPLVNEKEFSIQILKLNRDFFELHPLLLGDMDESFIQLMQYIGYSRSDSMLRIIDWHLKGLEV